MSQPIFNNNEIADQLKPLYQELIGDTRNFKHQSLISYCMQWGNKYSSSLSPSLMFIGRANNGWMCIDRDVEEIFNQQNENRAFNRDDQMIWVEDCANNKGPYNTNNSPFWRVVLCPTGGMSKNFRKRNKYISA